MFNPADHYVQVLAITPGQEEKCRERVSQICNYFEKSEEGQEIKQEVHYQKTHRQNTPALESLRKAEQRNKSPYKVSYTFIEMFVFLNLKFFRFLGGNNLKLFFGEVGSQ